MMEPKAFRHMGERGPEWGGGVGSTGADSSVIVTVEKAEMTGTGRDGWGRYKRRPERRQLSLKDLQGPVDRWE